MKRSTVFFFGLPFVCWAVLASIVGMYFTFSGIVFFPVLAMEAFFHYNIFGKFFPLLIIYFFLTFIASVYFSVGLKNAGKRKFFSLMTVVVTTLFCPAMLIADHTLPSLVGGGIALQYAAGFLMIAGAWLAVTLIAGIWISWLWPQTDDALKYDYNWPYINLTPKAHYEN